MSFISDDDIQKVREATDIVQIIGERAPVRQKGRDFWCCCPFHNEKTPSCKIDPATQLWHCFGCGEGGDVFGFVMKSEDLSFPEAVRYLADRAHVEIHESAGGISTSEKGRLREVCKNTCDFYHMQLMRNPSKGAASARSYLASRGFGGEVPKRWKLGFAPGRGALVNHLRKQGFTFDEMIKANVAVERSGRVSDRFYDRVMFPIFDAQGECIAFGGRVIGEGEPKYLNSQETPLFHKSNVLYGLDKAKASMTATGTAIVVEGYTDVIALHESGITNAVATLGTALTIQHIRQLSRHASKRIVYLFDGDAAGQRAADRALEFINQDMTPEAGKTQIELCAVTLPDNLDPAEFVARDGAQALRDFVANAKPLLLYGIDRRLAQYDLASPEGRTRAFADALSILAPIKDSLLAKDYAVQLAGRLQVREADALTALAALKPARKTEADSQQGTARQQTQQASKRLNESQKSRIRTERTLLALLAQDPAGALESADVLVSTTWHDDASSRIAKKLLDLLSDDPQTSAASLVSGISASIPESARILTSIQVPEGAKPQEWRHYLIEELQIGDLEQSVASMNATLRSNDISSEDQEIIFHTLVDVQNQLNAKRASHQPPWLANDAL